MFVTAVICFRFISDLAIFISWAYQQFISVASVMLLKKSRFIARSSMAGTAEVHGLFEDVGAN